MSKRPPRPLRVLMLMDREFVPPDDIDGLSDRQIAPWKTEYDIYATLYNLGHEVFKLGIHDDLAPIRDAISQFRPHVAFNMLEGFGDFHFFDQHMVSYLELLHQRYTGCNPRGLLLARDKALSKKILAYHRIRVPAFAVFPKQRRIVRPRKLRFPLLVKSVNVEGSVGISQASVVHDDHHLAERVRYIHEALNTYAIAEQYIEGRELYVGVIGNTRLLTLPVWELHFDKAVGDEIHRIATDKAKWDPAYQKRWGIMTRRAVDLPEGGEQRISALCKRIYRLLSITGYARLDFRLDHAGELYLLEANPNPQLAYGEDFAESAEVGGIGYEQLLQRIVDLGMSYSPEIFS